MTGCKSCGAECPGLYCGGCNAQTREAPRVARGEARQDPRVSAGVARPTTPVQPGGLRLVLPLPPRLTNSGKGRSRHWRALHAERGAYWEGLDLRCALGEFPPPPSHPLEIVEATAVLYLWSPMDDGNAMARLKWVEDYLVRRGYLVDDSREHLRWTGLPAQVIDRKNPRVELVVSPLPST